MHAVIIDFRYKGETSLAIATYWIYDDALIVFHIMVALTPSV